MSEEREVCMKEIDEMSNSKFLWKLLSNRLPTFPLATDIDADYVHIQRDTNHTGVEYGLVHKSRLRQMSQEEYKYNLFRETIEYKNGEPDYSKWNYHIRQLAMELILNKPREEFIKAIEENELPEFVRAVKGDPDYDIPTPTIDTSDQRYLLRTTEWKDYPEFNGLEIFDRVEQLCKQYQHREITQYETGMTPLDYIITIIIIISIVGYIVYITVNPQPTTATTDEEL